MKKIIILILGIFTLLIYNTNQVDAANSRYMENYMINKQIESLVKNGKIEEALDLCETVEDCSTIIGLLPNEANAYWLRAICYYENEDYKKSLKDIDKAISLGFTEAGVYSLRGSANCGLKNFKEAINDFNISIKLDPEYCEAYRKRAEVRGYLGDNKGAKEDCVKACELNPEYELDELLNNCIFSDSVTMVSYTLDDLNSVDDNSPLIFQKAKAFWNKITNK